MHPSQKFVEVLLKLGYEALSDNNFTHHDLEGMDNIDPASTGRDSKGEAEIQREKEREREGKRDGVTDEEGQFVKGINPKSIMAGNVEAYGEDGDEGGEMLPSVMGVMRHRVAQDMLAYRTNACTTIEALLLDFLHSPSATEQEAEMMGRIYSKEGVRVAGSRSISLESSITHSTFVMSPSLSIRSVSMDFEDEKEEAEEKVIDPDSDASPVTVGSPAHTGSDSSSGSNGDADTDRSKGSRSVGSDDDRVGNAISNLFGSIIKTFRSDSDSDSEDKSEDTATSPQGDKVKSSTAVSLITLPCPPFLLDH